MKKQLMSNTFTHRIVDSSQVQLSDTAAVTTVVIYSRKALVALPDIITANENDECSLKFTTVIIVSFVKSCWK